MSLQQKLARLKDVHKFQHSVKNGWNKFNYWRSEIFEQWQKHFIEKEQKQ